MAIGTYAELQTAVANWLDDTGLSSRTPEFITMAESRINRDLGTIRMAWSDGALTGTISSRALTLPTNFIEPRSLFLVTSTEQIELRPFISGNEELLISEGQPAAWAINGANIDLDRPCDAAYSFTLRYRKRWDIATDTTNWLLTNHPDIYLRASLAEAYVFKAAAEKAVALLSLYNLDRDALLDTEARSLAPAYLTSDPALLSHAPFNFTTG